MKLKVKDMDIATGGILVALLNRQDADELDLHHGDRVKVIKGKKRITAIVDIAETKKATPPGKIGIFEELLDKLGVKNNDTVDVWIEPKPKSVSLIKKKLDAKELSYDETFEIVRAISENELTDIETTYFIAATYMHGLTLDETVYLTKAMIETGDVLKFGKKRVFDKHCIGGVPGNRTTMVVVPIIAAAGLTMPKTSSRAITSPAGTADTVEVLADVSLSFEKIKTVVKKTNGCIVWGGAINLAPADDRIITVEHPLSIDAEGNLIASILAKKGSVSATDVLIDIPVGKSAKISSLRKAVRLQRLFEKIGRKLGMKVRCEITDGSQPIGNGIGPALEARDVLLLLKHDKDAPSDLYEKATDMAGLILEMAGKASKGEGQEVAKEIVRSKKAYKKFVEILRAQGKVKTVNPEDVVLGEYVHDVKAVRSGKVKEIDNKAVAKICKAAGCPKDKGAGIYLYKHVGDNVEKGEKLFTIYSENKFKLRHALELLKEIDGFVIA
ncbi:AMP phosphorylase [Candidatus Woesearchaeota archaeon]|nr:AMP phosphorylase [Candidatus Woesearchaeota archaeon]